MADEPVTPPAESVEPPAAPTTTEPPAPTQEPAPQPDTSSQEAPDFDLDQHGKDLEKILKGIDSPPKGARRTTAAYLEDLARQDPEAAHAMKSLLRDYNKRRDMTSESERKLKAEQEKLRAAQEDFRKQQEIFMQNLGQLPSEPPPAEPQPGADGDTKAKMREALVRGDVDEYMRLNEELVTSRVQAGIRGAMSQYTDPLRKVNEDLTTRARQERFNSFIQGVKDEGFDFDKEILPHIERYKAEDPGREVNGKKVFRWDFETMIRMAKADALMERQKAASTRQTAVERERARSSTVVGGTPGGKPPAIIDPNLRGPARRERLQELSDMGYSDDEIQDALLRADPRIKRMLRAPA